MYDTCEITKHKLLRPSLKLIGAKTRNRWRFYQYFPEYSRYCEPFMGTGGVLIGRPKVKYEQLNDLCAEAINYYHVLKYRKHEFWYEMCRLQPLVMKYKSKFFEEMKKLIVLEQDEVKQAALFYWITKLAFNGIWRKNEAGEVNSSYCQTVNGRGIFTVDWLDKVCERVKDVRFYERESIDTFESVADWDKDSFLFIDPPYFSVATTYNGKKYTRGDFETMYGYLVRAKYKWMLTINDKPFVRDLFQEFDIIDHDIVYSCSQTPAGRGKRPELIIRNY